jgi:hypothetical protein
MILIGWSIVAYAFWSVEEAIYWLVMSVVLSVLAGNLKLVEPDRQDPPSD